MKKKIALLLAAVMSVSMIATAASADDEYTQVTLKVEGNVVETDQPAVIVDSRTMVPVRVVAETLGCTVDWEAETKTAIFEQKGLTLSMVIGENELKVSDGEDTYSVDIDVPAVIINSRTMVPIRFLSENFGFGVEWEAETKTVNVTASADDVESGAAVEPGVESGAAVEIEYEPYTGTDDVKLRDAAEQLDTLIGKINEVAEVTDLTEKQANTLEDNSDIVATVLSLLDGGKYDQALIDTALESIDSAKTGLESLAKELNVEF